MNEEIQSLTNQAKECVDLLIPLEHEIQQVIAGQKISLTGLSLH